MLKTNQIDFTTVKWPMFIVFCGSVAGTIAVQFINAELLDFVIPSVLIIIAIYFICSPKPESNKHPKIEQSNYNRFVLPPIGFYDGMFGPGTGSFFTLAGVSCRGYDLVKSTAIAKSLNFSTNFASLLIFLLAGKIVWIAGAIMMIGQLIGAWLGSHCLISMPPRLLKLIVVLMCLGMLTKYLSSA